MNDIVSKLDIKKYAEKNTSNKMPIEQKYVQAYVDSLLNSQLVLKKISILRNTTGAEDSFFFLNSLWNCKLDLSSEPYKSLIAYSMTCKNLALFQKIGFDIFGTECKVIQNTDIKVYETDSDDELMTFTTDSHELTTDAPEEGIIQIDFITCAKTYNSDGTITSDDYETKKNNFNQFISIVKPARIGVLVYDSVCIKCQLEEGQEIIENEDGYLIESPEIKIEETELPLISFDYKRVVSYDGKNSICVSFQSSVNPSGRTFNINKIGTTDLVGTFTITEAMNDEFITAADGYKYLLIQSE